MSGPERDCGNCSLLPGDAPTPSFNVFNPRNNKNRKFFLPSRVGTVVPVAHDGSALLALEDGLFSLDLDTCELRCIMPLHRSGEALRMNDGKCDPAGRFWVRVHYRCRVPGLT